MLGLDLFLRNCPMKPSSIWCWKNGKWQVLRFIGCRQSMHHLDCWERLSSITRGVTWCGCHVTNVWSWVTLSFRFFHSSSSWSTFSFSPALQPSWLFHCTDYDTKLYPSIGSQLFLVYMAVIRRWKLPEIFTMVTGGTIQTFYTLHYSAFVKYTLIVKSTAHSVEVRVCQV